MALKEYVGSADLLLLCQLIYTELNKYVVKVNGKGLSEEDFTSSLKTKLEGIAAGAEVNVQANWNETDSSADSYIQNKPTIPAAQVQSDWSQSDNSEVDFIKNKPDLSVYAPLAGATFTGAVKVPTPASGADTTSAVNIAYLNAAISAITGISFDADTTGLGYTSLSDLQTKHPTGAAGTIYLVQHTASTANSFDEYFWDSNNNAYEKFGTTDVDLTNYLLKTDVAEISSADVTTIWQSVFGS